MNGLPASNASFTTITPREDVVGMRPAIETAAEESDGYLRVRECRRVIVAAAVVLVGGGGGGGYERRGEAAGVRYMKCSRGETNSC